MASNDFRLPSTLQPQGSDILQPRATPWVRPTQRTRALKGRPTFSSQNVSRTRIPPPDNPTCPRSSPAWGESSEILKADLVDSPLAVGSRSFFRQMRLPCPAPCALPHPLDQDERAHENISGRYHITGSTGRSTVSISAMRRKSGPRTAGEAANSATSPDGFPRPAAACGPLHSLCHK